MLSGMLGRKVGMTQIFGESGAGDPCHVIEAGPCTVTQVKTEANDGYEAVQLGFGDGQAEHTTRPMLGHLGHDLASTPAPAPQAAAGCRPRPDRRARQKKEATEVLSWPRPRPMRLRPRERRRPRAKGARAAAVAAR